MTGAWHRQLIAHRSVSMQYLNGIAVIYEMTTRRFHIIIFLLLCVLAAKAQTFTLQGRVTDEQMNPVELATVSVVQQGKMTMTNLKGEYSLRLMSADSVVVRFSMVGYKAKTRVLRRPKGRQTLLVQLYSDSQLDGVTVTGQ